MNNFETGNFENKEAWERAIIDERIIGPVYVAREGSWYLDTRITDSANATMAYGALGTIPNLQGQYRIPREALPLLTESACAQPGLRVLENADELDYSKLQTPGSDEGLVTVIATDSKNLAIQGMRAFRMVGFANKEAVQTTLETGKVTFFSRISRQLWTNGETSGDYMLLREAYTDCGNDTLLVDVEPLGPTCHKGTQSCFEVADREV